ncbi:EAL domain-containing protein [Psychromonas sp. SR45-3]|uniref:bifunctional diguanylate cyclase/phosphodiesterase n=1 Tax=Psychromonas sp. SR45-3 TaxID=2760930 RepID=UPI0015FB94C8|nr:EAL domain-containing protein [Psychromonas sp. SR45-3]MBB1273591.1 EAL domain-containing protein [Psychromonas sp. SR45-3]
MPLQRILFRSLKAKLLAMLMLVAFFSTISIASMFTIYELNAVTNAEQSRLNSIANILAPNLTAALIFEDQASATEQIKSLQGQSNIVSAQVEDMKGNAFVAVVAAKDNTTQIFTDLMVVKTTLQMQGIVYGVLTIKADYSLIEQSLLFFSTFLLVILVLILVLSFILSLFLRKSLIYPLTQLAAVADRVTKTNNYSLRSQVLSSDEVGNLASCFNLMLETIEQRDHSLEETVQQRTTALKVANTQLTTQAFSDPLSGLPNRRYILNKLADLIEYEKDKSFAVLALDLDGFKEINDTLGHDYGDLLLIAVSKSIASVLTDFEILARLGGDEFIILVENVINLSDIDTISIGIHEHLSKGFVIKGKHVYVTTSIGIAIFPDHGETVESIVKCADLAMYKAKGAGRNCHHFFDPIMLDDVVKKRDLIEDLRHSLSNNEFELYYQPIVDLSTNKICKAEALIRWNHPIRGLVPPLEFISVAEEIGLIADIGEWVACTAAYDLAELKKLDVDDGFQISINVSPLQFKGNGQWMKNWFEYIAELGLSHDAIIVEITENLLMESEENIRYQLTQLRDQGVSIAIDDFGVGYSSLSYLQKMDVDILKIDKSFVDGLETESNSRDLCKVMIMLALQLNIQVVAEGIENEKQKQYLLEAGCQFGQGYLFSKPMPFLQFQEYYFSHQSLLDLAEVNLAIGDTEYKVELIKKAI